MIIEGKSSSAGNIKKLAPEEIAELSGEDIIDRVGLPSEKSDSPPIDEPPVKKASAIAGLMEKLPFGKKKSAAKEETPEEDAVDLGEDAPPAKFPQSILKKLGLGKLKLGKGTEEIPIPESTPFPPLKDIIEEEKRKKEAEGNINDSEGSPASTEDSGVLTLGASTDTKSAVPGGHLPPPDGHQKIDVGEPLSEEEEKNIESEMNASLELNELKEKYTRVEKMMQEKRDALEKAEKSLSVEKTTQKEFNKVKDLLEKEIRDTKNHAREVQVTLTATKTESESFKKRIAQLEEKATKLEKEIGEKESEIDTLVKKTANLCQSNHGRYTTCSKGSR